MGKIKLHLTKLNKFFKGLAEIQKNYQLISLVVTGFLVYQNNFTKSLNVELKIKNERLVAAKNLIEQENQNLKENVVYNYQDYENSPIDTWIKKAVRVNGKIRFIGNYFNKVYEKNWGHVFNNDRFNLIGKNNFELGYPKDVAKQSWLNDSIVYATGKPLRKIEHAPDKDGNILYFDIIKYRDIRRKDTLIVGKILKYYDRFR